MLVDVLNLPINPDIFLYTCIGLSLFAVAIWLVRSYFIRRSLFKLCQVTSSEYRLLGTNLTGFKESFKLEKNNLFGYPSAIFTKKDKNTAYVCQYNPRKFNGRVKVRERYQMLLFMGIVMEKHKPKDIKGAICYQDHFEFINYEPVIYNNLLDLQEEYTDAIKEWIAPNTQPLFKRE